MRIHLSDLFRLYLRPDISILPRPWEGRGSSAVQADESGEGSAVCVALLASNRLDDHSPSTILPSRASGFAKRMRANVHCWFFALCICLTACTVLADPPKGPSRERFVPADQLDAILDGTPSGVMLPKADFEELLKRAQTAEADTAAVPAAIVIRSALYEVEQADKHAVVNIDVDLEQYVERWTSVKIPIGNLQPESATIDGQAANIGRDPGELSTLTLVSRRSGKFTLKLRLSTPLGTTGSDRMAAFQMITSAAATLRVACPQGRHLEINDLELQRPGPLEQPVSYVVPAGSWQEVRLKWTARQQQAEADTLVFGRTTADLQLTADNIRWNSATRISVFGGTINELSARVPGHLEITSVESAGLESWKLEDDTERAGDTRLTLTYRQPFSKDRLIQIAAITALADSHNARVPTLEFLKITSHSGRLNIRQIDQLRLMATVSAGIRHVGTNRAASSAPASEVFDFWLQDYELNVAVRPRDQELFVQANSSIMFDGTSATFDCELTVETLNAPLFDLILKLPDGWQVTSIAGQNQQRVTWREGSDARSIVVELPVPIAPGQLLAVNIAMSRSIDDPVEAQTLTLPVVETVNTTLVGGTYRISAASDLIVTPLDTTGLSAIGDDSGTLLFETQRDDYGGGVSVVRKPARLASRAVVKSWMDQRLKTVEASITVDVVHGTTRTMQLELPENLGEDLRFRIVSIRQVPGIEHQNVPTSLKIVEQEPGTVADGVRTFGLTFDQRFQGAVTLITTAELPRDDETEMTAPFVRVTGAVRQHGLVCFEAYPEQELRPNDDLTGLKPTDAGLITPPGPTTGRRTALVYRYVQPNYRLTVTENRFDTLAVPSAVCERIANVSVLSESGTIQRAAGVYFKCSGVQTLRFQLPNPDQSYLWSTVMNGEAVEVRTAEDAYLVAVPTGNQQHHLEILFESAAPSTSVLGKISQQSLQLSIDTEQGAAQPVDILEQTWEVRYPQTAMLVDHRGSFVPQQGLQQPGWLQWISNLTHLPTWDSIRGQTLAAGIFALILCVGTLLIARRSWIKLLGFVVVCGIGLSWQSISSGVPSHGATVQIASIAGTSVDYEVNDQGYNGEYGEGAEFETATEEMMPQPNAEPQAAAPSEAPATPSGDIGGAMGGFGGGGGGGGFAGGEYGSGGLPTPDASGAGAAPPQTGPPQVPMGGPAGLQSHTIRNLSRNQLPAPVDQLFDGRYNPGYSIPAPVKNIQYNEIKQLAGAARLSIRATVAAPADYQSRQFRSIAGKSDGGDLELVVQDSSRLNALRAVAAAATLLVFVVCLSASPVRKITVAVSTLVVALAAVPVVPNQWQSLVDGIFFGSLGGIALWVTRTCICGIASCFKCCCGRLRKPKVAVTATILLLTLVSSASNGQDAGMAERGSADPGPDIVLPYSPDGPPLLADRIFLSRDDFLKLYRQANPRELENAQPPAASAVIAAVYESGERQQIDGKVWSQRFVANYVVRTHAPDTQVTLPIGSVAIRSARLNDEQALVITAPPLETVPLLKTSRQQSAQQRLQQSQQRKVKPSSPVTPASPYSVFVASPGLHMLDVEFDVPATVENLIGRIDVPLRPVPAGTLVMDSPDKNLQYRVNGRTNTLRQTGNKLLIPIGTASDTRIEWRPATATVGSDTIYHTTVNSALTINDAGLTHHSMIQLNCRQGNVPELEILLPDDYTVQKVEGVDLASWTTSSEDQRRLKVQFLQPVEDTAKIHLTLFQNAALASDEQRLDVPALPVVGASRDSGSITVLAGRELEIRVDSLSGVTQLNTADAVLPEKADANIRRVLAWRYTRHPIGIAVRVFRTPNRLVVNTLSGIQVESKQQLWTTLIQATITGAPRRRLEVEVPSDYLALKVTGNDLTDWYFSEDTADSDAKVLNLQFAQAKTGRVNAVIQAQVGRGPDADLVRMRPPRVRSAADASRSEISVWLDAASTIRNFTANDWRKSGGHPSVQSLRKQPPAISFSSAGTDWGDIQLTLEQVAAASVCESVTVTNVTETSVELTLALTWEISGNAAVRDLVFSLPAALADVYDFQISGLRQLDKTIVDDTVRFHARLQQPISRQAFVMGTGTLPLPESRQIEAQPAIFGVLQNSDSTITSQSHYWVIVNQSSGLLEPVDPGSDGDDLTAADINTQIPRGFLDQSVAIRRLRSDRPGSAWELKFPDRHQVSPAVIALAAHTTILAEDGTWRSRHELTVRNEARQFLPVTIPSNSRFLYCRVASRPTRIVSRTMNDETLYLIPIPQSGESSTPFDVEFSLAGQVPVPKAGISGDVFDIPAPVFPEFRDNPDYGITTSRNTWSIYVPQQWQAGTVDDPRRTNVVAATALDFEDASLMCVVDNSRSMINSWKYNKGRGFVDGKLLQNLNDQIISLNTVTGNTVVAEQQRQDTLAELYSALEEPMAAGQQQQGSVPAFDNSTVIQGRRQDGNRLGRNVFLESNESRINRFNFDNNSDLFMSNGSSGIVLESEDTDFNFQLPKALQTEQDPFLFFGKEVAGKKSEMSRGKFKGTVPQQPPASRSQLLDQRSSNRKMQLDRAKTDLPPNNAPADAAQQFGVNSLGDMDSDIAAPENGSRTQTAIGQLSLNFAIPEDGVRHDFTRTTGNPTLALRIRDTESVKTGFGLIWAVLCGVVGLMLLRGLRGSWKTFVWRLLITATVAGLAGGIVLPPPLRGACMVIFYLGLIVACATVIVQSSRSRAKQSQTA